MRSPLLAIVSLFVFVSVQAQDADRHIRRGNDFYKQQQYPQAELAYNEALVSEPNNTTAKFNRANALYKQNKADEAIRVLDDLAFKTNDASAKSKASYNKGVILSAQKKLEESIEAYKESLRHDPNYKNHNQKRPKKKPNSTTSNTNKKKKTNKNTKKKKKQNREEKQGRTGEF